MWLRRSATDWARRGGVGARDQDEARAMRADKPVGFIFGVGPATQERLSQRGFRTIADLQRADEIELMKQFSVEGRRLWRLAGGLRDRSLVPHRGAQTSFRETTFQTPNPAFPTL